MIKTENLSKKYEAQVALHSLNLDIKKGEIYALLGSNGAGKSTTIHLLMGFMKPTSGLAYINELQVKPNDSAIKQWVAYIPEVVNLYPNFSALENLDFFSGLSGFKYTKDQQVALLREAGLRDEFLKKPVGAFSKGMRQKVGISIALGKQAKAILMDEPTSGLDPYASNEFSEILHTLSKKGVSILMATHDLFRAKESGHRIGIMHLGHLLLEQDTSSVSQVELEQLYMHTIQSFNNQDQKIII
ncbi:ABC transporter ATP-binding protein [Anditalea andensis]|uniref:ABC transporter ATP-binding protein n=1 Tax=Anditalea andensis TaxID=1048983 RepID=A0A074KSM1_9BACT|nr:ABC transporter ATP-binding protein [Anditalea andensis]KEO71919.1 ABC transporter ATP-binding protein [Anditalea andensis]